MAHSTGHSIDSTYFNTVSYNDLPCGVLHITKLNPHIPLMKNTLAEVMNVDEEDISIKATTTENLGFTGRQEGISAYATVLIQRMGS